MPFALRYALASDVGLVRSNNQDSGYAGPNLLVVADGMGGHAGGDIASSLAVAELAPLDAESPTADGPAHLAEAIRAAHAELIARSGEDPQLRGLGTTVTALLRTGNRLAVAHLGDSRGYLFRDGVLSQITRDHTFVQSLIDEGRISAEEAENHPMRSAVTRVLSDMMEDAEADLSVREARIGDRYLLCSDGLSGVVSLETMQQTVQDHPDPAQACQALVRLALRGGAPDNVTCIVAEIVPETQAVDTVPLVAGAAASSTRTRPIPVGDRPGSSAERAAALTAVDASPDAEQEASAGRSRARTARWLVAVGVVVVLLAGGGFGAFAWLRGQYFVSQSASAVALFRGLPDQLGPVDLFWLDHAYPDVPVADLPAYWRTRVQAGIPADSRSQATGIVSNLRAQAAACRSAVASPTSPSPTSPSPTSPSPTSPSPTSSPSPTTGPSTSPSTSPSTTGTTGTSASPSSGPAGGTSSPPGAVDATDCAGVG